jgi:hypothetical protein
MNALKPPPGIFRKPPVLTLWLIFCAFCTCAGWFLSAIHQLNAAGYCIMFLLGGVSLTVFRHRLFRIRPAARDPSIRLKRFRRIIPLTFLVLGGLAFLGGALYPPTNYDALAYRIPRVLHWLAEHRWHWIHTEFNRVNTRACGIEWITAPIICLAHTDRFLFLINVISFFLLPGLIFRLISSFGISRQVAWVWMWVLPAGYCFLLQAGSVGNDLFPVVFVLAALDFALRARNSGRVGDVWLSLLSAALFTGAKANTLPLVLVWLVLVIPALHLLRKHLVGTVLIGVVCAAVSFLPTAVLNSYYCSDWTGARAEHMEFKAAQPWARLIGNSMILAIDGLMPPIAPFARAWNDQVAPHLLPPKLQDAVNRNFQTGAAVFALGELQTEEGAGLGAGTTVLLIVAILAAVRYSRRQPTAQPWQEPGARGQEMGRSRGIFIVAVLAATVFFLFTSFARSTPRLMAPYFPLLVLPFLFPRGHAFVVRKRWLSYVVVPVSTLAALLLVANPARPLFPTGAVLGLMQRFHAPASLLQRAERVYSVYRHRHNAFAPALALTPADARVLGMFTYDDPETSMWLPFGSRRIVHVCLQDDMQVLRNKQVRYIWVNLQAFKMLSEKPFEKWLEEINGREHLDLGLDLRAAQGTMHWALVELP